MSIKDFGRGFKESLHGAVNVVRDKVQDIDTAEIKGNIQDAAEAVKDKVAETGGKASEQMKKIFQKKGPADNHIEQDLSAISTKCALKIIYFLMAADGEIFHGEEEKFDAIGKELDPGFEQTKAEVINECKASLELAASKDSYVAALRSGIDNAITHSHRTEDTFITPKLLVWDLLTIAYSDDNFNETEQSLIDYVVEKFNVNKAIYLEMLSSILTVFDLENELAWIKTTNRPYLTIEAHVNEINERKSTIMESVIALISL